VGVVESVSVVGDNESSGVMWKVIVGAGVVFIVVVLCCFAANYKRGQIDLQQVDLESRA
jgi:hypothetical protein